MIEDETFAVVVRTAAVLEIFQDAAFELEDAFESFAFHERPGFLAANAAGAEHDDGLLLHLQGQAAHGGGEIAEMIDADGERVLERAELHFVIVARVEQGDGTALVEPPLQFLRRELGGRAPRGINAIDTERDDLFLQSHEHPGERLMLRLAELRLQILQAGQAAQLPQQQINLVRRSGDEQVDALGAEENGALQFPLTAQAQQACAQVPKFGQRGELIGRDVDHFVHRNGGHPIEGSGKKQPER